MQSVFAGGDMYVRCCCQWQLKHVNIIWPVYITGSTGHQLTSLINKANNTCLLVCQILEQGRVSSSAFRSSGVG